MLYRVAVAMFLGGLLGNLADGWRVGYPVDYILVGIRFNVADVAILSGGSLLTYRLLYRVRGYSKDAPLH